MEKKNSKKNQKEKITKQNSQKNFKKKRKKSITKLKFQKYFYFRFFAENICFLRILLI